MSLEALFYRLEYEGELGVVRKGDKVGTVKVRVYPTDARKMKNIAEDTVAGITIYNPRDYIEKTLFFAI